jgi:hypothetical protein
VTSTFVVVVACGGTTTSLGSAGDDSPAQESENLDPSKSDAAGAVDAGSLKDTDAGKASGKACEANPIVAIAPCPPGEYCVATAPGTCGSGTCKNKPPPPPPFCGALECACDGVVRCQGHSASGQGMDVSAPGSPSTPCGIPCGPSKRCNGLTTYCEHAAGGASLANETFECLPIPAACATNHSCACVIAAAAPMRVCVSEEGGKISLYHPLP